jgi:type II secretory pathway pseudopilin PulG
MVFKFIYNLKKEQGTTLIELLVVIFIIVLLSMILVSNFPEIQRQLALSRVTYKLAQDLRRAEDLALSGVKTSDSAGNLIEEAKGYGVYVEPGLQPTQYIIYADKDGSLDYGGLQSDSIIEVVDISENNPSLFIAGTYIDNGNITDNDVSINFNPPNPTTTITSGGDICANCSVGITLGLKTGPATRTVLVNTSGAISVK